jgi:hypothetical protein
MVILQLLIQHVADIRQKVRAVSKGQKFRGIPSRAFGGMSAREGIAGLSIFAVDVKPVSPPHDVQNMTAFRVGEASALPKAQLKYRPYGAIEFY